MKSLDCRPLLEKRKGSRVSHITVYQNGKYYGFAGTGEMNCGIAFLSTTKKGLRMHKNGTVRWYFGDSNSLVGAVQTARKRYGIKLPTQGWKKYKVKTYNTTTAEELVNAMSNLNLI